MAGLLDMTPEQQGLLALGLGMMQNSRGRSLGESFGAGGMQGLGAMQHAQQLQQLQAYKDMQMQMQQKQLARQDKQDAIEDAFRASMQGIDPNDTTALSKALFDAGLYEDAIKLKRGNGLGNGDYQFIAGPDGRIIVGDKNAGSMKWGDIDGTPVSMAVYDPTTKQKLADAQAGAGIKDVPMPDGSTVTTRLRNVPTVADPVFDFKDPKQAISDLRSGGLDDVANQAQQKYADYLRGLGVSQTPGQKKAQEETAKLGVDMKGAQQKKAQQANNMLDLLTVTPDGDNIDTLIQQSTGSGLGAARDYMADFVGIPTDAGVALSKLKTLGGWLVSNVPRMEGPQSDRDTAMYKEMAGNLADPMLPASKKQAALNTLRSIMKKYSALNGDSKPSNGGWSIERAD